MLEAPSHAPAEPLQLQTAQPPPPAVSSCHQAALDYLRRAWSIIPVDAATKRPLLPWKEFQERRATPDEVEAWFRRWPDADLGVVTGEVSGIAVVDVDRSSEADFDRALGHLGDLVPGEVAPPMARTRSGGVHLYFRYPSGGLRNATRLGGLPIDLRGEGGYAKAPPTLGYTWISPPEGELPEIPPALLQFLRAGPSRSGVTAPNGSAASVAPALSADFAARYPDRVDQARRYAREYPPAIAGQHGHDTTFKLALVLTRSLTLPQELAIDVLLKEYNPRCQPPWTEAELRHKITDAARSTQVPLGNPADVAALRAFAASRAGGEYAATAADAGPTAPPATINISSELGAAQRLIAAHGEDLRYVWSRREWLLWDGRRWHPGAGGHVLGLAAACARKWTVDSVGTGDLADFKAARNLESSRSVAGAAALAAVDRRVLLRAEQLDADPMLLTCANGTIDLRSGKLRPHRREDLVTHLVPHAFDPSATAPRWSRFLDEITGNEIEVRRFLQRWFGYCITGFTVEHALLLALGRGCNGKSVMVETIQDVLGLDLATPAPPGLLLVQHGDRHPTELQHLAGRRLVVANELPKGGTFNDERLKWLCGGDTLIARAMRQDFASFTPTHKIVVCANELPRVNDASPGFWRRMRVVPFNVSFEGREDRDLSRTLRDEAPGILRWLVDGCLAWQRDGLGEPQAVRGATAEYRRSEDVVGLWIKHYAPTIKPGVPTSAETIYSNFKLWAEARGERPVTQTMFGRELAAHGWTRDRSKGRSQWTPARDDAGELN
jgi:putative DNA primase/helicase